MHRRGERHICRPGAGACRSAVLHLSIWSQAVRAVAFGLALPAVPLAAVRSRGAEPAGWTFISGSETFPRSVPAADAVRRLREALRVQALEEKCGVEILSTGVYLSSERSRDYAEVERRFTQTMTRGIVLEDSVIRAEWDPSEAEAPDAVARRLTLQLDVLLACETAPPDSGLTVRAGFTRSCAREGGPGMAEDHESEGLWITASATCFLTLLNQRPDGSLHEILSRQSNQGWEAPAGRTVLVEPDSGQTLDQFLRGDGATRVELIRIIATAHPLSLHQPQRGAGGSAGGREIDLERLSNALARIPRSERSETLLAYTPDSHDGEAEMGEMGMQDRRTAPEHGRRMIR